MATELSDALNGVVSEESNAPEMEAEAPAVVEVEAGQEAAVADEQPEPEKPEKSSPPRDEKGKFAKKEKSEEKPEDWSYHAYKDEKDKRQTLERELEAERRERAQALAHLQAHQQPRQEIDPIDDPQGFREQMAQQIQNAQLQTRLEVSEVLTRQTHGAEAVDAANAWLLEPAQAATLEQLRASPDPWGGAVAAHKRHLAMQEIGDDPAAYRERIEAEIRARVEAEMAKQAPQVDPQTPMPANFASARNAGSRKGPAWSGPTPLGQALRR